MATLSSALNYAMSGLSVTSAQSALVSRNVSFASDENYTRKTGAVLTLPGGAPAIAGINRSIDSQLLEKFFGATSAATAKDVLLDAMNRLGAAVGDPENDASLPALFGKLQSSLQSFEANPSSLPLASAALAQARSVAGALNSAAGDVTALRADTDKSMSDSVQHINSLLAQFKVVNDAIIRGSGTASDLSDGLDQRDAILKQLSEEIGIRTVTRSRNDMVIYAEGGAVLFEGSARSVTMQPTVPFGPESPGQAVFVDGVAVTGPASPMPISTGKLGAFATLRDETAVTFQHQIDEMAATLIRSFSESDQSASPALPDVPGLFVDKQGGIPVPGAGYMGLASRIAINALADPDSGGNPMLIRDGGFGGATYIYNQQGAAFYQTRIVQLVDSLDSAQNFDSAAGLSTSASLKSFGLESASWVESLRQAAQAGSDAANATRTHAREALLRITGVNVDDEMAKLLDLEKSYQASSKIISVVDSMLAALLQAVG